MGAKTIEEYFLIKEEKWDRHHFPLFVGRLVCAAYTYTFTSHTHAYRGDVCGACAHTYTPPPSQSCPPSISYRDQRIT